ncbi:polymorphic toxin-type HINT domain-containing protein [Cystobacter ferrugineus]|uniref:polymorphic toxin-type HINT domain-containing protein n=1 Tax=Cystobacter ferrugineus TaxID=83449 RepID=UPI0011612DB8|nr:polymorphic toxin-type HINT domain-containing protein [Cystobacter ferrugineus]
MGQLSGVAFEAADLSRGGYTLESPFVVPSDHGPLLAPVFPQYSVEQGLSEWGMGWQSNLFLTRFRQVGALDYATDGLTSPWGELVQGLDGAWYPRGLSAHVRVETAADGFVAFLPDGSKHSFGGPSRVQTSAGVYSWPLTEVVTATGRKTRLTYEQNASGRPFLKTVSFGGVGNTARYQLDFIYEAVRVPFSDWRSSRALVLDQRVKSVKVSAWDPAAASFRERWHYVLFYEEEAFSPAFYLKEIVRVFASGESEPPVRYTYHVGTAKLTSAEFRYVPQFDAVVERLGWDVLYPTRSSPLDINEDGQLEFEHNERNLLVLQGPQGFSFQELPAPSGPVHKPCRWDPYLENPVRQLVKLRPEDPEYSVLDVRYGAQSSSQLVVCGRDGVIVRTLQLPGYWQPGPNNRLVDLDRDHRPDFIDIFSGGYRVLPNQSDASGYAFGSPIVRPLSPAFAADASWLHDMNGDGLLDIVSRFDSGLAVWFGTGARYEFTPEAIIIPFLADGTALGSLSDYQLHFVDVNKDGAADALLALDGLMFVFINDGIRMQYIRVPAMFYPLGLIASYPMVVDVAGSGDTEVVVVEAIERRTMSVALNAAETGLLWTADDGKGSVLSFEYARGPAEPGTRQRATVLKRLVVSSSGQDPVAYSYQYFHPRVHSRGKHLLGFDSVVRHAPSLVEQVHFLNDDTNAGLVVSSSESDPRTPGVIRYEERCYDLATIQGLPWRRLKETRAGHAQEQGSGTQVVEERTEYPASDYEAEVCPARTVLHTANGSLTTERRRAVVPALVKHLHCLEDRIILSGQHADTSLNFHHEAWLTRNAVGLVERVQSVGEEGLLTLQEVMYRPDYSVERVSVPGRGHTFFTLEPDSTLLRKVTSPDGSVLEVTSREPLTDAIRSLSSQHGTQLYTQAFRYDGLERLQKNWNSLGHATEADPALLLAYEYATDVKPAVVDVTTLVDGLSGARRRSVEWSTASGAQVASAQLIPEGWAFDGVTTFHPEQLETREHNRPTEPPTLEPAAFTYQGLHTGMQPVARRRSAGLGHEVAAFSKLHADVERQVVSSLAVESGLLRREWVENGVHRTRFWLGASEQVLRREEPDGTPYGFERDALDRVRRVLLPDGKTHRVAYDSHGRVKQVTREGLAELLYEYEPVTGLLRSRRFLSAQGVAQRLEAWTYDSIGRKSVEEHTDLLQGTVQHYRFFYDGATPDEPGRRTHLGELSAVQGDGYLKTFDYRADGKLSRYVLRLDGWRTVESEFTYADNGEARLTATSVRDATGGLLSVSSREHRWDAYGRLSEVWLNGYPLATFAYDSNGQASTATFTTGDRVLLGYDALTHGRLSISQWAARGWESSNVLRFNTRGFLDHEAFVIGGENLRRQYAYSPRGFLTDAGDSENVYSYGFDGSGLPTSIEEQGAHRDLRWKGGVLTTGNTLYTFDALGRTLSKGDLSFSYGPNGHLALATRGGNTWRFLYDENGHRLLKFSGTTPVAAYLEQGAYLDAGGLAEPFKFSGQLVGLVRGNSFHLLATDARGTLMAELDGTPRLASPFGNRTVHPDSAAIVDYVQKGYDADLDLIRMGVRDYDPMINRFLTPDPLFLEEPERCVDSPAECNLYGYAGGNPVAYVDPTGKALESVWDAASLGMGLVSIASWDENTSTLEKALDVVGVVADAAALAVPFVPGGAGAAIKGYRAVDKVVDVVKNTGKAGDALQVANKAESSAKLASKADEVGHSFVSAAKGCEGRACSIPGQCFVAGTQVLTQQGPRAIEQIKPGDLVWSRSETTGEMDWKPVVRTFLTPDQPVLQLELTDEASGQKSVLGVTGEHPFWVKELGWVGAAALMPGHQVASVHGGWLRVGTSTWAQERASVFNFEVAEYHTYFAGTLNAWVHNECKPPKTYQTYTKTNPVTGEVYVGRTSGRGDPLQNVAARERNHHMTEKGFGPAVLDKSSPKKAAIRGREQMMIDKHAKSGNSGNAINGISPNNPKRAGYLRAAKKEFGTP